MTENDFEIEAEKIMPFFKYLSDNLPEITLRFSQDGLSLVESNTGSFIYMEASIEKKQFSKYPVNINNLEIGIDLTRAFKLVLDMEGIIGITKLNNQLIISSKSRKITMPLIIPKIYKKGEYFENYKPNVSTKIKQSVMKKIISKGLKLSNHIIFNSNEKGVFICFDGKSSGSFEEKIDELNELKGNTTVQESILMELYCLENLSLEWSKNLPLIIKGNSGIANVSVFVCNRVYHDD